MRILKNNKIFIHYVLPIIMLPAICLIFEIVINFLFQSGGYLGTFLRGLYELVLKNI